MTIPSPLDPYFFQKFIPDFEWDLFTDEEIEDIYDDIKYMDPHSFQGPSRPPLQGPETPPIQGPYLSDPF